MKQNRLLVALVLFSTLLLAGCAPRARVGALQTESQSVELGDANSVHVDIVFGAGILELTGGADKLLEADFNYNVAMLEPEVEYTNGTLLVRQPDGVSFPDLRGITDFQNEWRLRLYDKVPMDLGVDLGSGTSKLLLAGLSLTRLDIKIGAGISTIDLNGDWAQNLDVTIDSGAGDITVRLPKEVGARVEVDSGASLVKASGLTQDGNVYTNAAYGTSEVTLQANIASGIGRITLVVEEAAAVSD
jgi:hypothetical protein